MFDKEKAEGVLGFILDNEVTRRVIDERAHAILGRGPQEDVDEDEDEEWWAAVTQATNELCDTMKELNNSGAITKH